VGFLRQSVLIKSPVFSPVFCSGVCGQTHIFKSRGIRQIYFNLDLEYPETGICGD
jgi:hypothetical protein